MQQGFTTQAIQASHVSFAEGRDPVVLGDEGTSEGLRSNLRARRQILDDIFQAAKGGHETEVLRLSAKLASLVKHPSLSRAA